MARHHNRRPRFERSAGQPRAFSISRNRPAPPPGHPRQHHWGAKRECSAPSGGGVAGRCARPVRFHSSGKCSSCVGWSQRHWQESCLIIPREPSSQPRSPGPSMISPRNGMVMDLGSSASYCLGELHRLVIARHLMSLGSKDVVLDFVGGLCMIRTPDVAQDSLDLS